jgi:hypothetical protein
MDSDIRCAPDEVDAGWLTAVLADAGVADGATVTDVEFKGLIGTGQTGSNARFALTWDDPTGRPASVVAKFPSDDPHARMTAFASGSYFKESVFYNDVVQTVDIRTPVVYSARFDGDAQRFVLVMEDIAGSEQGDQILGLSDDEAAAATCEAVKLHAPRWGDTTVGDQLSGGLTEEMASEGLALAYQVTMEGFLARLGHRLDPDVVTLVHDLAPLAVKWIPASTTPRTVVHMDYRPDNFLFGREDGAPEIVVVDWQTASHGLAMNDVAYMIGGGFLPDRRAAVERDLVDLYRQRLNAAGVAYDADECWRDYRLGSIWGVIMTVIATVYAAETERGNDMLTAMGNRHGRHALDLDALSLLR